MARVLATTPDGVVTGGLPSSVAVGPFHSSMAKATRRAATAAAKSVSRIRIHMRNPQAVRESGRQTSPQVNGCGAQPRPGRAEHGVTLARPQRVPDPFTAVPQGAGDLGLAVEMPSST